MEELILVDKQDNQIGTEEKMKAHQEGKLHRAFSVFVFNSKGEMLLQKRADGKYHCPGLWTNTCCSHPRPGETTEQAAKRRLKEEMGFETDLKEIGNFIYKVGFDNGLTEHEFDHVFVGRFDDEPKVNPEEVGEWKFVDLDELLKDIEASPEKYTYWFKVALEKVGQLKRPQEI